MHKAGSCCSRFADGSSSCSGLHFCAQATASVCCTAFRQAGCITQPKLGDICLQRIAQEREKLGEGEQPEEPVDSKKATPLSAAWCAHWTQLWEALEGCFGHMAQAFWLGCVAGLQGCQLLAFDCHFLQDSTVLHGLVTQGDTVRRVAWSLHGGLHQLRTAPALLR